MIKSPCGGFYMDNDTLYVEDSILKTKKQEFEIPEQIKYKNGDGIIIEDNIISVNEDIANKQYVDDNLSKYRIRDLFGVGASGSQTIILPDIRQNLLVVFYSVDPQGNANISNSKAVSVPAGESETQNNLTVNFNIDGKTIILTNSDNTNAILGQYYGYNNQ